ncbi:MAG TPA: LD-carboxypeptidase [Desulfatiglandales bacterium]|nr:LD-carboxypeptidase [Desulfatiglandales bacterium]
MTPLPIIKGHRLEPNQTVGIISPASPVTRAEIQEGLKLLESFPLKITFGKHVFKNMNYLAGSDYERLSDLHEMFLNPDIRAIFCARGGYGSIRLLDKIDSDLIKKNPKILIGFSDLTALLLTINKQCGLITIHGPTLKDLQKNENWLNLSRLISTDYRPRVFFERGKVINKGSAKGILLGGNLSTICSLLDTPFLPSFKDIILFLEDKGESPYRLDRMLTQLSLGNHLNRLSALIIGHMEDCGEEDFIYNVLRERLSGLNVPVVTGLPVGHGRENLSLPLGLPAFLDTEQMVLEIHESAVC